MLMPAFWKVCVSIGNNVFVKKRVIKIFCQFFLQSLKASWLLFFIDELSTIITKLKGQICDTLVSADDPH